MKHFQRFIPGAVILFLLLPVVRINGSSTASTVSNNSTPPVEKEEETGGFVVDGGEYGKDYDYQDGILLIRTKTKLTISGSVKGSGIVVEKGVNARLVLNELTVNSNRCALDIQGDGAEVYLKGSNVMTGGAGNPGIRVPDGALLQINGREDASLSARGGIGSAGIGMTGDRDYGKIQIQGGGITAVGGKNGAGIGSEDASGIIEIKGGVVQARGGNGAVDMGNRGTADALITLDGDALLQADDLTGQIQMDRGILQQKDSLTVYGDVTLPADLLVAPGEIMKIEEGGKLTISQKNTLENQGQMAVYGSLDILGVLENEKGQIWIYPGGKLDGEDNISGNAPGTLQKGEILLAQGDVVIEEGGYRQNGILTENTSAGFLVCGEDVETENTILIQDGAVVHLTLDRVRIQAGTGNPAFEIGEGAELTLKLEGDSCLAAESLEDTFLIGEDARVEIFGTGSLLLQADGDGSSLLLHGSSVSQTEETEQENTETLTEEGQSDGKNEKKEEQEDETKQEESASQETLTEEI